MLNATALNLHSAHSSQAFRSICHASGCIIALYRRGYIFRPLFVIRPSRSFEAFSTSVPDGGRSYRRTIFLRIHAGRMRVLVRTDNQVSGFSQPINGNALS